MLTPDCSAQKRIPVQRLGCQASRRPKRVVISGPPITCGAGTRNSQSYSSCCGWLRNPFRTAKRNQGSPPFVGICIGIIIPGFLRWCRIFRPSPVSPRKSGWPNAPMSWGRGLWWGRKVPKLDSKSSVERGALSMCCSIAPLDEGNRGKKDAQSWRLHGIADVGLAD